MRDAQTGPVLRLRALKSTLDLHRAPAWYLDDENGGLALRGLRGAAVRPPLLHQHRVRVVPEIRATQRRWSADRDARVATEAGVP